MSDFILLERDVALVHEAIVAYVADGGCELIWDTQRLKTLEEQMLRYLETGYRTKQGVQLDPRGLRSPVV